MNCGDKTGSSAEEARLPAGRARGLVLVSGGLDSQLAICVLKEQGLDLLAITFESPFFDSARARQACEALGVPLRVVDFTDDIIAILKNPGHGFGSNMNPCIDCHARMLKRAGDIMKSEGYHFVATGEVLFERPMSQSRKALGIVAKESGYADFILRPLSARQLEETDPERRGLVNRAKLLSISGRQRLPQFRLAERFGLRDYPTPSGGCRLTDPNYTKRLRDLVEHEGLDDLKAVRLLKVGRHLRLGDRVKFVVGRNEEDNSFIERSAGPSDTVFRPESVPGPSGLLPSSAAEDHILVAASICARYCDHRPGEPVSVLAVSATGERRIAAMPASEEDIARRRL